MKKKDLVVGTEYLIQSPSSNYRGYKGTLVDLRGFRDPNRHTWGNQREYPAIPLEDGTETTYFRLALHEVGGVLMRVEATERMAEHLVLVPLSNIKMLWTQAQEQWAEEDEAALKAKVESDALRQEREARYAAIEQALKDRLDLQPYDLQRGRESTATVLVRMTVMEELLGIVVPSKEES